MPINGTSGDDALVGTSGDDTITGLAGNDSLTGNDGNDVLEGGLGDDTLNGGNGTDTATYANASGSVTVDLVTGTASGADGNDTLIAIERVTGSAFDDVISGSIYINTLDGGAGNDLLNATSGDFLYGGTGIDTVDYSSATFGVSIRIGQFGGNYGAAIDVENVIGTNFDDYIVGTYMGDNLLDGGAGDDVIEGNGGNDQLYGGDGDDELTGGIYFNGGAGTDRASFWSEVTGVAIDMGLEGIAQDIGWADPVTIIGIENLSATPLDDVIIGNDSANVIWADDGDDQLSGEGGDDWFYGGFGNKIIDGGDGVDTVQIAIYTGSPYTPYRDMTISLRLTGPQATGDGSTLTLSNIENLSGWYGNDRLTGNDGTNVLDGYDGSDVLWGFGGDDTLIGGYGTDTARYTNATGAVQVNLLAGTATGADGNDTLSTIENVVGSGHNDTIYGDDGANQLDGGAGADYLRGRNGNDIYIVDDLGDQVIETSNGGTDTVKSSVSFILSGYAENLILTGTLAINGTGSNLANVLTGNTAANILTGLGGNDTYIVQDIDDQVIEAVGGGIDTVQSTVSFTLGANIENLILTGLDKNGAGNELANTIVGNDGHNILDGGAGADRLEGGKGDDTYVIDNVGDQVIEPSDPYGYYGAAYGGTDVVQASISYTLGSAIENLTLTGSAAINATGNDENNVIIGNSAANLIDGRFGWDTMKGGAGDDTYIVDNTNDSVVEVSTGGIDLVKTSTSFTLGSYVENLTLTGTWAVDGTGNNLANIIIGNGAANTLNGSTGADTMKGGAGGDTYIVDNVGDYVGEVSTAGVDTVLSSVSFVLGSYVENVTLTGVAAINTTGNGLANVLAGNSGANVIDGRAGADTMQGGDGDDTYVVDNAGDQVLENDFNTGNDTVKSSVSYALAWALENLTLTGSAAINATGNSRDNILIGNSAANVLFGDSGNDVMKGGNGNDTYIVHDAGDQVIETSSGGTDTIVTYISYTLGSYVENLALGDVGFGTLTGNSLANTITGNGYSNLLDGGTGADTLIGGMGDDTYIVDNAGDRVIEQDVNGIVGTDTVFSSIDFILGDDVEHLTLTGAGAIDGTGNELNNQITGNGAANILSGGSGNDDLLGGGGNDLLTGGAGSDDLSGGDGNDSLAGGQGEDLLEGGAGTDQFRFDTAFDGEADILIDFSAIDDSIVLSQSVFTAIATTGTLSSTAFRAGTVALDADDRIIYDQASGKIYYDADGNGAGAKIEFAHVDIGTVLTNGDFFVI